MTTEKPPTLFPFIDCDLLLKHRKARKHGDPSSILQSPNSEDWLTWNVLRLLQRRTDWWPAVVRLMSAQGLARCDLLAPDPPPVVDFWRQVRSPPAYGCASRERMHRSRNAAWRKRATNPRAVEGPTEVDAVFDDDRYLVFVEAKLSRDVSKGTKYDPLRNQIERNIDCAIEQAGSREPVFSMFVKDRQPDSAHSRIIECYRSDVSVLQARLPHRDPDLLSRMVANIAVVEWREIVALLPDTRESAEILTEIHRRID